MPLSCYIIYSVLLPSGMCRFIVGRGRNGGLRIIGDGQSKDSIRYYIQTDIFCLGKVEVFKWYSSHLRIGLHGIRSGFHGTSFRSTSEGTSPDETCMHVRRRMRLYFRSLHLNLRPDYTLPPLQGTPQDTLWRSIIRGTPES